MGVESKERRARAGKRKGIKGLLPLKEEEERRGRCEGRRKGRGGERKGLGGYCSKAFRGIRP